MANRRSWKFIETAVENVKQCLKLKTKLEDKHTEAGLESMNKTEWQIRVWLALMSSKNYSLQFNIICIVHLSSATITK